MRALLCLVLLAIPAHAGYPKPIESLDWGVADSDLVVRGGVIRTVQLGDRTRYDIAVHETLKGDARAHLTVTAPSDVAVPQHRDVLFFVAERADGSHELRDLPGDWEFGLSLRAIDLKRPPLVLTRDRNVVRGRQAILTTLRRIAKRGHAARASHRVSITRHEPASKALGLAVGIVLVVPADVHLEAQARRMLGSRRALERARGIEAIEHFRSERNITLVTRLVSDRDETVRDAAIGVLDRWRVPRD